jgi:hypothetical protein
MEDQNNTVSDHRLTAQFRNYFFTANVKPILDGETASAFMVSSFSL